ncbi:MAG: ABC transporter permease, partial [Planctomycetes bacterium]|nr:ABC transporter permease [Planctomycetota bacterium]
MQLTTLCIRSLAHHRRAGIAVALGAAVGTAVLTGALLVGDSMRGSLRDVALSRLGGVDYALRSGRFFRKTLADDIASDERFQARFGVAVPLIMLRGAATHPTGHATVHRVNVLGIDDRFSALDTSGLPHDAPTAGSRQVILNRPLAQQLGAKMGDDILLRVSRPADVSSEMLLGRRETAAMSVRLSVAGVIPTTGLGQFSLEPKQPLPLNAYLPLDSLQRLLDQPNRVNTILVAGRNLPNDASNESEGLQGILHRKASLTDVGLSLRVDEAHGYVALESSSFLIEPPVEAAAMDAAADLGLAPSRVLTYL